MRNKISRSLMIVALTLSFTEIRDVAFAGPFEDSMAAYDRGDYATTLQLLRPLAERGDPQAQNGLGARVILSYGTPLGELYTMKNGKPSARRRIKEFALDKWFFAEELYRPKNDGFVFFVHTKFMLIDPLSDDPLVCSGSANFSPPSLTANDENMLLIRGDTRVADIYMTEFDRIFRHFYFRDIANELAGADKNATAIFLDETDGWTDSYFEPDHVKTNRRMMFFATPATTWSANAATAKKGTSPKPAARRSKSAASRKKLAKTAKSKKKSAKKPGKKKSKHTSGKWER